MRLGSHLYEELGLDTPSDSTLALSTQPLLIRGLREHAVRRS